MKDIKNIKTKEELDNILDNSQDKIILLKFSATWCGPCRSYKENIENLDEETWEKLTVVEVDVEESEDLASEYGVRNIPLSVFFKNKEVKEKQVGLLTTNALKDKINELNE